MYPERSPFPALFRVGGLLFFYGLPKKASAACGGHDSAGRALWFGLFGLISGVYQ